MPQNELIFFVEYLVTYTQLSLGELCEDTVLIGQQAPLPEQLVENWKVDVEETHHPTKGRTERATNTQGSDTVEAVRLFEGKRVEDFEVIEFAETREDSSLPTPITPRRASTWHVFSDTEQTAPATSSQGKAQGTRDHSSPFRLEQRTNSPPLRRRSVGPLPSQAAHGQAPSDTPVDPKKPSVDELKSMSFMLSTIDEPEMTTEYMQTFQTCLDSLLKAWPDVFPNGPAAYDNELQQVQLSLQTAEKLDKVLILEEGNSKLAAKPEYRMSLMKLLGLHSVEQELDGLSDTVKTVVRLLRHNGIEDARKVFADNKFEEVDSIERGLGDLRNIARRSFLAWPWIISDTVDHADNPQDAALSLARIFRMILDDSDEHIKRRNDKSSYLGAEQKSFADLEKMMHDLNGSSASAADEPSNRIPTGSQETSGSRLGLDHGLTSKDRRELTVSMIQSLVQVSKDLVELFIPCGFSHPMLEKIWGSLISSSQVSVRHGQGLSLKRSLSVQANWKLDHDATFQA